MSSTQPAPGVSPERIFQIMNAHQQTSALEASITLGLFTAIAEGAVTAEQIAVRCEASSKGIRVLSDYLCVLGLLKKQDGTYSLTPESGLFLDQRSPAYIGAAVRFLNHPKFMEEMHHVSAAVKKGGTVMPNHGTMAPDHPLWVDFAHSMVNLMTPAAQAIAGLAGSGPLKVLDIAAGHGVFGITIAKRNPEAQVYASDWENVLAVAKEHAEKHGVGDRYHLVPGSAFDVDLGSDYDLVLLTNILHHFDAPTNEELMARVHNVLKPGGRAVTLEFCPNEDRVSPPAQATFALTMLCSTDAGDAYTVAEYERMFSNAGFASTQATAVPGMPQTILISTR